MRLLLWSLFVASVFFASTQAQSTADLSSVNVANVPDCAKACLSNSTQYATDCAQIDVKCLCSSSAYVSALSCCLATNCNAADQQTAIQFNIQECSAVNSTAPNFVGCSPFSLTTGRSSPTTTISISSVSSAASTLSGNLISVPTAYTNKKIATVTFGGTALLTGSCSVPMFAQITETAGSIIEFPQVGCALNRGACCPFDPNEYAGITKCPSDYQTTAGACCPNGYSVYYTAIGAEIPCYSHLTQAYLPASIPTNTAHLQLITDTVFSRKYILVKPGRIRLPTGGIIGITVNAVLFVVVIIVVFWYMRRRKAKRLAAQRENTTFPPEEPPLHGPGGTVREVQMSEVPAYSVVTSSKSPQELASPESMGVNSSATTKGMGLRSPPPDPPSSPPAYDRPISRTSSVPQEMPGSTYMHEHHPAFTASGSQIALTTGSESHITMQNETSPQSPPRTPSRSPATVSMDTRSPGLSPSSPYRTGSPLVGPITPLGSPRLPNRGSTPRFREGTM